MPSEEVRRLLKLFGVAVTEFEDAVTGGAAREEVDRAAAMVKKRLAEVGAFIERLEARGN